MSPTWQSHLYEGLSAFLAYFWIPLSVSPIERSLDRSSAMKPAYVTPFTLEVCLLRDCLHRSSVKTCAALVEYEISSPLKMSARQASGQPASNFHGAPMQGSAAPLGATYDEKEVFCLYSSMALNNSKCLVPFSLLLKDLLRRSLFTDLVDEADCCETCFKCREQVTALR